MLFRGSCIKVKGHLFKSAEEEMGDKEHGCLVNFPLVKNEENMLAVKIIIHTTFTLHSHDLCPLLAVHQGPDQAAEQAK